MGGILENNKPLIPAELVISVGILAVSTSSVFIRLAQADGVSSIAIAAVRLSLAVLILAPLVFRRGVDEIRALSGKQIGLVFLAGTFLAFHFAAWITSLEYTSVVSSVVMVNTAPLWVALLSPFLLKEKNHSLTWVGIVLALVGGILVSFQDICFLEQGKIICHWNTPGEIEKSALGNLLALIGALMSAGYMLVGRKVRPELSLTPYIFLMYGIAACWLLVWVLITRAPLTGFQPQTYIWLAALAIIPQLLGHSSFNWALKYLPAAFVSVTLLGEPIGTAILAMIVLSEIPGGWEIGGGVFILCGIILASQQKKEKRPLPAGVDGQN